MVSMTRHHLNRELNENEPYTQRSTQAALTARSKALGWELAWSFQGTENRSAWLRHRKHGMRIRTGIAETNRGQKVKDFAGHLGVCIFCTHKEAVVSRE